MMVIHCSLLHIRLIILKSMILTVLMSGQPFMIGVSFNMVCINIKFQILSEKIAVGVPYPYQCIGLLNKPLFPEPIMLPPTSRLLQTTIQRLVRILNIFIPRIVSKHFLIRLRQGLAVLQKVRFTP
ncbi:MAG TPA: hypothetical protein DIU02_06900 [Subdoligranulum sp.]|nr:hypothetical protein [Subdoligranulum sp.]